MQSCGDTKAKAKSISVVPWKECKNLWRLQGVLAWSFLPASCAPWGSLKTTVSPQPGLSSKASKHSHLTGSWEEQGSQVPDSAWQSLSSH